MKIVAAHRSQDSAPAVHFDSLLGSPKLGSPKLFRGIGGSWPCSAHALQGVYCGPYDGRLFSSGGMSGKGMAAAAPGLGSGSIVGAIAACDRSAETDGSVVTPADRGLMITRRLPASPSLPRRMKL